MFCKLWVRPSVLKKESTLAFLKGAETSMDRHFHPYIVSKGFCHMLCLPVHGEEKIWESLTVSSVNSFPSSISKQEQNVFICKNYLNKSRHQPSHVTFSWLTPDYWCRNQTVGILSTPCYQPRSPEKASSDDWRSTVVIHWNIYGHR